MTGGTVTVAYAPGLPLVLAGGSWLGGLSGALLTQAAAQLVLAASAVSAAGRRTVLFGPTAVSVFVPGAEPRQVTDLRTAGDAEKLTSAPAGTWPVTYSLWLSTPAASP